MKQIALRASLLFLFAALPAQGQVHYHDSGAPWKQTTKKGPDAVVGGWYYNLETLPDTHGSPIMGMGYTALGAFIDPASFRKMMDNNRWWFTLAHCADGTFYFQPNRDYNASDFTNGGSRISASAVVALIFSAKKKNLYLTGAHRK